MLNLLFLKLIGFLKLHKLILGSAQFAENYGVVRNKIPSEVFDLLSLCKVEGIDKIDTSIEYGNAHEFISKSKLHQKFKIITKVSLKNLSLDSCSETDLEVKFNKFISSLHLKKIYCLMIHNSEILNSQHSNFILNKLKTLKRTKIIKKIGISIYDPKELDDFYHHDFDIIQGPYNIIDQRIKKSGWLDQIQKDKKEFHARSIFLQGLLAQNSKKKIPSKFLKWEKFWDDWFNWHNLNALSTTHTCLSFALSEPKINYVIIGVDNVTQLKQIFDLYKKDKVQTNLLNDLKNIIINDQNLIDPRNWKNLSENWQ